ncbi:DMT family transporter [Mycobacterium sp. M1]|uniref:DMT family transporter n=1 Tax=Mycolicibacter acidiphilus TaxID=2835306 RepID=A0ABS5RK62_9MYCO|nr:DMT family transporter [Mycolicibacter acidiphilus]MBS9534673.1 DMT family transporter [Mycolicibacter acidiphilus]
MPMSSVGTAAALALGSALCVAVGDVLQQRATQRLTNTAVGGLRFYATLLHNRRWRWGATLLLVSIALQAEALDQGSVLLVQALLVLSLLFALPISARMVPRRVTGFEWSWAAVLTAAVIVIVTVGNPQAGQARGTAETWALVAGVLVPLLAGCVVAARIRGGALAAVLLAFVSGSLWAVFAVLTKGVMAQLHHGPIAAATSPELYAWLLVAIGGFAWEQSAFRAGSLTASMPTLEVSQPLVAAALGVVVLGETLNTGPLGMAVLALAVVAMTVATVQLARADAVATHSRIQAQLSGAAADRA